jgi:hypothetical protein
MAGYWLRYGAHDAEDRARMHNGGPKGPQRESTRGYWFKVREILNEGAPVEREGFFMEVL